MLFEWLIMYAGIGTVTNSITIAFVGRIHPWVRMKGMEWKAETLYSDHRIQQMFENGYGPQFMWSDWAWILNPKWI